MVYGGALVRRADQRSRATAFRSACRRPINMGAGMSGPAPFIETKSGLFIEAPLRPMPCGDTPEPTRPATRHDLAGVALPAAHLWHSPLASARCGAVNGASA